MSLSFSETLKPGFITSRPISVRCKKTAATSHLSSDYTMPGTKGLKKSMTNLKFIFISKSFHPLEDIFHINDAQL